MIAFHDRTVSPFTRTMRSPNLRAPSASVRSEEHTSELQSLAYLVCRLLLEKKKKKIDIKEDGNTKQKINTYLICCALQNKIMQQEIVICMIVYDRHTEPTSECTVDMSCMYSPCI